MSVDENGARTAGFSIGTGEEAWKNNDLRYSIGTGVTVEPASDYWNRSLTTDEARKLFPALYNVRNEDSGEGDSTQIAQTVNTYRRVFDILQGNGFSGRILDASSGLGLGTKAGREEYGFDVDDIEPFYNGERYYGNGSRPKYRFFTEKCGIRKKRVAKRA